jgi:hypothetical protein
MNKKWISLENKVNRLIKPENVTEVKCDLSFTKKTILWEAMDALLNPNNKTKDIKKDH